MKNLVEIDIYTDFYEKNKFKIEKARKIAPRVLMHIKKNERLILSFDDLNKTRASSNDESLECEYGVTVSKIKTVIKIKFRINLSFDFASSVESFSDGNILVRKSFQRQDEDLMMSLLADAIKSFIVGKTAEKVFYESFLKELPQHSEVINVYRSGERDDMKKGIDFVVFVRSGGNKFQINFNLKSSANFVEEHKVKYPKVSTFIFNPKHLRDRRSLSDRFFKFLHTSAKKGVVHF